MPVPLLTACIARPLLVFVTRKHMFVPVAVHVFAVSGIGMAEAAPLMRSMLEPASAETMKPREIALNMIDTLPFVFEDTVKIRPRRPNHPMPSCLYLLHAAEVVRVIARFMPAVTHDQSSFYVF
jgi:hypothetical protein